MSPREALADSERMTGSDNTKQPGSVSATFRDFWVHRPARPLRGGKVAGVSAALGRRYGIDPVLIRVAFVVGAFYGGAGFVLYLLGWLLLPKEGELAADGTPTTHPPSGPATVVLVLVLIGAGFGVLHGFSFFGLAIGLGALYLIHRNYGDYTPEKATATSQVPAESASTSATTDQSTLNSNEKPPPRWDPLGAAPFAWDLPEPSEPKQETEPARAIITMVTLALALIAGGMSVALGTSFAVAFAIALAVLGAGMITGSFLRGGNGLIRAAIPVGVLALAFNVIPVDPWYGFADYDEHPATVDSVRPDYRTAAGEVRLDLRELRFSNGQEIRTRAEVGIGDIKVTVPSDANVDVHCASELGSVNCLGSTRDGHKARVNAHSTASSGPGAGHIILDLTAGTGDVEVNRE